MRNRKCKLKGKLFTVTVVPKKVTNGLWEITMDANELVFHARRTLTF